MFIVPKDKHVLQSADSLNAYEALNLPFTKQLIHFSVTTGGLMSSDFFMSIASFFTILPNPLR
ncbi:hypothetical protein CW304_28900 [Bacillus sp. UFRGS-B20]|nr:hypothetical protein CW304_28900 [Bacillus sp. UFRGS-B20]